MFIADATNTPTAAESLFERLSAYLELTKPRIVTMVVATAFAGFWSASAGAPDTARLARTMVGVVLLAAGIFALNQYLERDLDVLMRRTRGRPLPAGRLGPLDARRFGWWLAAVGLAILGSVNLLSAAIGAATLASYLYIYTPLKTITPHCTLVGAFPGAVPPLLGWAAARGEVTLEAWSLFAILFLWQFPHFHAIALLYRDDYANAGIRLWPVVEPEGRVVSWQIIGFTIMLLPASVMPVLLGAAGPVYAIGVLALGAGMLCLALRSAAGGRRADAQRLLLGSVVYLPALLGLLISNR
jgi:protoheme IX farnesyltransferase